MVAYLTIEASRRVDPRDELLVAYASLGGYFSIRPLSVEVSVFKLER
jgi:hypothetical protein